MDWRHLGIEPTKDKKEITRAYRSRLADVNPEDKPEEFKLLREAYEEALRLAEQEEVPQAEKTPVELWTDKLKALYMDLKKRLDPRAWKELLSDDICIALDTRPLAEEALLRFFMDYFYLTQEIWQLLDDEFSFTERAEELFESYPREFIEQVVLDGIRLPKTLDAKYFIPGEDGEAADQYTRLYLRAKRANLEDARKLLAEAAALPEQHPYGEILGYALDADEDKEVDYQRILAMTEEYPDSVYMSLEAANIFNQKEQYALAEQVCRSLEKRNLPDSERYRWQLAKSLAGQGNYKDAMDLLSDLMNDAGGDQRQIYELNQTRVKWNASLMEQYKAALEEDPENYDTRAELAMCHLIADQYDEALECTLKLPENMPDPYAYNNLLAQIYAGMQQFETALPYAQALTAYIPTIQPDGTKKTADRIEALARKLTLQADILYMLKRFDEALEVCRQAVEAAPANGDMLSSMVRLCMGCRKYRMGADYAEQLTRILPDSYHSHLLLAFALFELKNDRDAFAALNKAMSIDASDLSEYVLKLRILIRNNAFEDAHGTLDFLAENGITNNLSVDFCKALLAEFEEKEDKEEVLKQYQSLAQRVENGEHFDDEAGLYFRLAVVTGNAGDVRKDEALRNEVLEILEKGLNTDHEDIDCKDYKAWIYKEIRDNDKALELYHQLEQEERGNLNVESNLAEIYYRNLQKNADKALVYYQKLLDNAPSDPVWMFYTAMCHLQMGDLETAEKIFLQEEIAEPEYSDAPFRLSFVYEATGDWEKALTCAEKALEIEKQGNNNLEKYYLRKMQILRRLGRPQEAIDCIMELVKTQGSKEANAKIFDTYAQFGMWNEAKKHVRKWIKTNQDKDYALQALIRTDIIPARMVNLPSQMDYANNRAGASDWTKSTIDILIAAMEGKYSTAVKIWLGRVNKYGEEDYSGQSFAFTQLAWLSFLDNKPEKAREYAELGLIALERAMDGFLRNETIFRARKALLLGFMGKFDESQQEMAAAKALPLCENCAYCRCKDADIYEAFLALMQGKTEEAKTLAEQGLERFPDEEDYIIILNYIKKNSRKKW